MLMLVLLRMITPARVLVLVLVVALDVDGGESLFAELVDTVMPLLLLLPSLLFEVLLLMLYCEVHL